MSTPSSINSIFNRIRNFRIHLDVSNVSASSDSQHESTDIININQQIQNSDLQIQLNDTFCTQNDTNHSNVIDQHRSTNNIVFPLTPKLSSPSTISSSNVRISSIQSTTTKPKKQNRLQIPSSSSSSSNMSISPSPSSFSNVFKKLQSFRVSLDSPQRTQTNNSNRLEIESLNTSVSSLLQQQIPADSDDLKSNINPSKILKLSFESQTIANIPSHPKPQIPNANCTRKSQNIDLKQFKSLPSPPKYRNRKTKYTNNTKQQILPFHDRYREQMKDILGIEQPISVESIRTNHKILPHYYYTSPSVISEAPTIPSHLLLRFPNNNNSETLQEAYLRHKRHRESVDLSKNRKKKKQYHKKRSVHKHNALCPCSCHSDENLSPTPMYPASYDGDNEEDEKKEILQRPVIESTIGNSKRYTKKKQKKRKTKKKDVLMSPPIAVTIKRRTNHGVSDMESEKILKERIENTSLSLRGGIIEDLVRLSSISPSPIWYNNRNKLHIKEIRTYSREYRIIASVCCALWTKYELEILKLFKLSWSQRIMAFGEASVMFYVVDIENGDNNNTAKHLFNLAEDRFNGLEYIELKYRLNYEHKFALLCIVDSYYIINETDQYFIDQSHCIPSYLIRNKNSVLS